MNKIKIILGVIAILSILLLTGCTSTYDNNDLLNCNEGNYNIDKDVKEQMDDLHIKALSVDVIKESDYTCKAYLNVKPNLLTDSTVLVGTCVLNCVEPRLANRCLMQESYRCMVGGEEISKDDCNMWKEGLTNEQKSKGLGGLLSFSDETMIEKYGKLPTKEMFEECNKYSDWRDLNTKELQQKVFESCCSIQ